MAKIDVWLNERNYTDYKSVEVRIADNANRLIARVESKDDETMRQYLDRVLVEVRKTFQ